MLNSKTRWGGEGGEEKMSKTQISEKIQDRYDHFFIVEIEFKKISK